jgi:hypothetical protein
MSFNIFSIVGGTFARIWGSTWSSSVKSFAALAGGVPQAELSV